MPDATGVLFQWLNAWVCPVIICAECGEKITDAHKAVVVWYSEVPEVEGTKTVPIFLHKNDCDYRYERKHGLNLWSDLESFLVQLLSNVGIKTVKQFSEIQKAEKAFGSVGL